MAPDRARTRVQTREACADKTSISSYADSYARSEIRERRRAFRKHWPLLAAVTAGLCVLFAVVLKLSLGDLYVPVWLLGPVFAVALMGGLKSQLDGTYNLEAGIEAEGWTTRDLRRALGPRWCVVDGVSFG